ncbi:hypothetical protein MNBD_GAMMA22-786 [hydrothermal vent metagenome]|uniref:Uncharacterized protein n=1 Tax=hydrothermal vent metagenome TaxID=652676 RepID=A0A3B1A1E2_9ZZZZ
MSYLNQLDQMLDAEYRLVTIESEETERVLELFTQLTRFSNKAFYFWQNNIGMYRLGASHIVLPHTKSPDDILTHIDSSKHYGVYLLDDFNDLLKNKDIVNRLKKIAEDDYEKVIILLGANIQLPKSLKQHTLRSKHRLK